MWLVAGLLFLAIQTSLLIGAWRKATSGLEGQKLLEIQWVLGTQIFMFVVAAIYNIIALAELSLLGVRPNTALDGVIIMLLLVTLGMAFARYRRRPTDPDARLLLATGTKAAPQWLQAAGLLLLGSTGVHPTTIGAITAMGATRFLLAKQAVGHYQDKNTVASYKIAFRDLTSILAMGVGWLGARL